MWNRKDVKAKGLAAFKANYWKCVATALLIAVIAGGSGAYSGGTSGGFNPAMMRNNHEIIETTDMDENEIAALEEAEEVEDTDEGLSVTIGSELDDLNTASDSEEIPPIAFVMLSALIGIIVIVASAIGVVIKVFIANPLKLGCDRFFRRNLEEPAQLENIVFAFKSHYKNVTKIMFLQDLYIFLWSLLFVIPGIVKTYEYRMVSYLLTEDPTMSAEAAFAESKRLMNGNKWKAFVLDLSFIGWKLLSLLTCGVLDIFFVTPYIASTDAALYEAIKYGTTTTVPAEA